MGQATEKSQGADIEFRVRPNILMHFAQTWAERHGTRGGFSITRFSDTIRKRVTAELTTGKPIKTQLRSGQMVDVVDLSDVLSGFVYYAVMENNNGYSELVSIVDAFGLEEMIVAEPGGGDKSTAESPSAESENSISPVDKMEKIDVAADELVLLRYSKEMSRELPHGEVCTTEVRRGELQGMILKLLADGISIDSMKVWSNGRRPQIDVKL